MTLVETAKALSEVVVTATRTERTINDIPMPVQLVDQEQIERIGSIRLNEVLAEQTGLQMISDHGAGLQMQGLSSDYILILINGEPVIGRTAGTTDLSRLSVNNIERIGMIRGPSSSLYGSEAMAEVVNIITKDNALGWNGTLGTPSRSFNTWDAQAEAGYRGERLSARLFANRLRSDGYDITENICSPNRGSVPSAYLRTQAILPHQRPTATAGKQPLLPRSSNDQLNLTPRKNLFA